MVPHLEELEHEGGRLFLKLVVSNEGVICLRVGIVLAGSDGTEVGGRHPQILTLQTEPQKTCHGVQDDYDGEGVVQDLIECLGLHVGGQLRNDASNLADTEHLEDLGDGGERGEAA